MKIKKIFTFDFTNFTREVTTKTEKRTVTTFTREVVTKTEKRTVTTKRFFMTINNVDTGEIKQKKFNGSKAFDEIYGFIYNASRPDSTVDAEFNINAEIFSTFADKKIPAFILNLTPALQNFKNCGEYFKSLPNVKIFNSADNVPTAAPVITPAPEPDIEDYFVTPAALDIATQTEIDYATATAIVDDTPAAPNYKFAKIITDDEKEFEIRYEICECGEIIASHLIEGTAISKNPEYPAELQPRDRNRVSMHLKSLEMAANLRPLDLLASRNVNQGAPVVNSENIVLNGNGRALSISVAYNENKAEKYRAALIKNAFKFGFTPEFVQRFLRPVLIRKIIASLNDADIKSINQSIAGGCKLGATEQAKVDASNIKLETFNLYIQNEFGDLTTAENQFFVSKVLQDISNSNDINAYICADGKISVDGVIRVKRAILAAAYNDTGALTRMTESTDDNIRNISNALLNAAPEIAKINDAVSRGTLFKYEISNHITAAANKVSSLRDTDKKVSEFLKEQCLFSEFEYSAESKELMIFFDKYKRSCKKISQFLISVANLIKAQGSPLITPLIEVKQLSLLEIIKKAMWNFDNEGMASLFDAPPPAPKPDPGIEKLIKPAPVEKSEPATQKGDAPTPPFADNINTSNSVVIDSDNSPSSATIPADGTIKFSFTRENNKKSVNPMFSFDNSAPVNIKSAYQELKNRAVNLETSYRLLIDAIIYGTVKITPSKFGDKKLFWNKNLPDKYSAGIKPNTGNYYSIRNINIVANYAAGLPFAPQFCGTWFNYSKKEVVAKFDAVKKGKPAPVENTAPAPVNKPAPPKNTELQRAIGKENYSKLNAIIDATPYQFATDFWRANEHLIKVKSTRFSKGGGNCIWSEASADYGKINFNLYQDSFRKFNVLLHEGTHSIDGQIEGKGNSISLKEHDGLTLLKAIQKDGVFLVDSLKNSNAVPCKDFATINGILKKLYSIFPLPYMCGYNLFQMSIANRARKQAGDPYFSRIKPHEFFAEFFAYSICAPDHYANLKILFPYSTALFEYILAKYTPNTQKPVMQITCNKKDLIALINSKLNSNDNDPAPDNNTLVPSTNNNEKGGDKKPPVVKNFDNFDWNKFKNHNVSKLLCTEFNYSPTNKKENLKELLPIINAIQKLKPRIVFIAECFPLNDERYFDNDRVAFQILDQCSGHFLSLNNNGTEKLTADNIYEKILRGGKIFICSNYNTLQAIEQSNCSEFELGCSYVPRVATHYDKFFAGKKLFLDADNNPVAYRVVALNDAAITFQAPNGYVYRTVWNYKYNHSFQQCIFEDIEDRNRILVFNSADKIHDAAPVDVDTFLKSSPVIFNQNDFDNIFSQGYDIETQTKIIINKINYDIYGVVFAFEQLKLHQYFTLQDWDPETEIAPPMNWDYVKDYLKGGYFHIVRYFRDCNLYLQEKLDKFKRHYAFAEKAAALMLKSNFKDKNQFGYRLLQVVTAAKAVLDKTPPHVIAKDNAQ